jgi:hypothetical protein
MNRIAGHFEEEDKTTKARRHKGGEEEDPGKTPRHQVRISGIRELGAGSRVRGGRAGHQMRAAAALLDTKGRSRRKDCDRAAAYLLAERIDRKETTQTLPLVFREISS